MRGTVEDLSFCDWFISLCIMASSFIHVVADCRISFHFKAKHNSIELCISVHLSIDNTYSLYNHLAMDTWVRVGQCVQTSAPGANPSGSVWKMSWILRLGKIMEEPSRFFSLLSLSRTDSKQSLERKKL